MRNIEPIKRAAVKFAALAAVFYLAGSFAAASFDLSQWNPAIRAFVASFGTIVALVVSAYPD